MDSDKRYLKSQIGYYIVQNWWLKNFKFKQNIFFKRFLSFKKNNPQFTI